MVEENPITNLLADGSRELFQCDLGLINSGIIIGIKRGEVSNNEKYAKDYTRDVLRIYLNKKEFVNKALKDRWVKI